MIPRVQSRKHWEFIRQCPCLLCGDNTTIECAHVRYSEPLAAKPITGIGNRAGDWVIPLCGAHHREQHQNGERNWWAKQGIDPVYAALALKNITGDFDSAMQIITAWQGRMRR